MSECLTITDYLKTVLNNERLNKINILRFWQTTCLIKRQEAEELSENVAGAREIREQAGKVSRKEEILKGKEKRN